MKDNMLWKVKRRANQEKKYEKGLFGKYGERWPFLTLSTIYVFSLLMLILSGQLLYDWITSPLCAVYSQSLASVALGYSHLKFGLQWGVVIWMLLPGGHQCSPCVCHWQATWLLPSNKLTSCNVHFSLSDQLIVTWSCYTLGDSELLCSPPPPPKKMLMKFLNHNTSLILENANYCMIEENVDLWENIVAYLLSWLSKLIYQTELPYSVIV